MYAFEIFQGRDKQFYWRFRASNGEIMCGSEGYTSKSSARNAIESMQKNTASAEVKDLTRE